MKSGDLCLNPNLWVAGGIRMNMTGMFAISRAGHDIGQMYVIIKEDADFVYLADGKYKKLDNPKKKNKKHIQIVKAGADEALAKKLKEQMTVYDEEIKRAIKLKMNKEVTNVKS